MDPAFTILLPIHRPPEFLPFAVDSVLSQNNGSFELHIICDGAPAQTIEAARAFETKDVRITAHAFEKGERNGEAHRDAVLRQARGRYVCQISDDDLWFPDHLDEIESLLQTVDFGNLTHCFVRLNGKLATNCGDLADPALRHLMQTTGYCLFGPTASGYRLDAYKRLAQRWSPAPADLPSDLFMWRKFLSAPDIRCGSRNIVTSLHPDAQYRREWSVVQRSYELFFWATLIKDPSERDRIRAMFAATKLNDASFNQRSIQMTTMTATLDHLTAGNIFAVDARHKSQWFFKHFSLERVTEDDLYPLAYAANAFIAWTGYQIRQSEQIIGEDYRTRKQLEVIIKDAAELLDKTRRLVEALDADLETSPLL